MSDAATLIHKLYDGPSDDPHPLTREEVEVIARAFLSTQRELAVAKKAAQDYCWQRFKGREPMNLSSPSVFTSHEWQKIGEAIDAALAAAKEPRHE